MRPSLRTLIAPKILLVTGLVLINAPHASSQDWVGVDGFWSESNNWNNNSVPGITDVVFIGNAESLVKDLLIQIDQPVFVEDLRIGNGNRVINRVLPAGDAFPVSIVAELNITGENDFNPGPTQNAGLFIHPTAAPVDLAASVVSLGLGGELGLREGAVANVGYRLSIGSTGSLNGHGVVNLQGDDFSLRNSGDVDPRGQLTLNQIGAALIDLDGQSEGGRLLIGGGSPSGMHDHLILNGTSLSDSFSGTIDFANDRHLTMNLSDGWTADADSILRFSGTTDALSSATINGGHVTLEGRVNLISLTTSPARGRFNADATINDGFSLWQGPEASLRFNGETTINGGEFNVQAGASFLLFTGPTTLRGGVFNSYSDTTADGSVIFEDETEWDGEVTINGVAVQARGAKVTGDTVINATRFDMDGVLAWFGQHAEWQVSSSLTVKAENIDIGNDENVFEGAMTISSGSFSRLNINLTDPEAPWTMGGTLNLENSLPFGATKLGGSDVRIAGAVNVDGTDIRVDANTEFAPGSVTTFVDSASGLSMRQHGRVMAGAEFVGDGLLRTALTGSLTLDDGANTSNVGVFNLGHLDIDPETGIVAVDRFENTATGTLAIDLSGHLLGEEFDHLQVTGEALLDGTLAVDFLTEGLVGDGLFIPEIGDEFLILTSLDGVTGEFTNVLPTIADGNAYGWEVLYHPHDVTIRLDSVGPAVPEPASLVLLAVGVVCTCFSRR